MSVSDWDLFVELSKRFGASTSRISSSLKPDAVWLNNIHIKYDYNERRAYWSRFSEQAYRISGPTWLDNDILQWIDTLLDR